MAENDNQINPVPTQPAETRFGVQRIYIKDASFEAPDTPDCFRRAYTPQVNFSITAVVKSSMATLTK